MTHRIIRNEEDLESWIALLRQRKFPFTAQAKAGADRSLDQNATVWMWAGETAGQLGDCTAKEVQHRWKLEIGVPILRSEEPTFCSWYDEKIKGWSYVEKLDAMNWIPVTSLMTTAQMKKAMDLIQQEASELGVRLTDPEERKAA